jgi:hypothetical protein
MERVDGVELQQVDQEDPHQLPHPDPDRVPVVVEVEGDRVDGVEVVLVVEVDVEAVHDDDQLVVRSRPAVPGVDDEGPVEPLRDVLGQGAGVAVIEMDARWLGVELVGEAAARRHLAGGDVEDAVHAARMDAVEVHAVRM